jgi:hypothetical protein
MVANSRLESGDAQLGRHRVEDRYDEKSLAKKITADMMLPAVFILSLPEKIFRQ